PVARREGVGGERPQAARAGLPGDGDESGPADGAEAQGGSRRGERPAATEAEGQQQGVHQPVEQAPLFRGLDSEGARLVERIRHGKAALGAGADILSGTERRWESRAPESSGYAAKER